MLLPPATVWRNTERSNERFVFALATTLPTTEPEFCACKNPCDLVKAPVQSTDSRRKEKHSSDYDVGEGECR